MKRFKEDAVEMVALELHDCIGYTLERDWINKYRLKGEITALLNDIEVKDAKKALLYLEQKLGL